MKVKELIKKLSELDPELKVILRMNDYGEHGVVTHLQDGLFDEKDLSFDCDSENINSIVMYT